MSNKAFDKEGNAYYADNFTGDIKTGFLCPDKKCRTSLYLKNIGSDLKASKKVRPYFSAYPNRPHATGCAYGNTCVSNVDLEKEGFVFEEFFRKLTLPQCSVAQQGNNIGEAANLTGGNSEKPCKSKMTTVNMFYRYCLQHKDEDLLPGSNVKIYEVYQEKRNEGIYNSKRTRRRFVKLNFVNCNFVTLDEKRNCYKIWCYFPHTANERPPGINYTLGFENSPKGDALMRYFCKILTPLKKQSPNVHIVVCGEWDKNHCRIDNKRQIYILGDREAGRL